jgi:hypothetical protein
VVSENLSGCDSAIVTVDNQAMSFGNIPANGTQLISFPGVVHLNGNAPTSCQKILFTVPIQVTGRL